MRETPHRRPPNLVRASLAIFRHTRDGDELEIAVQVRDPDQRVFRDRVWTGELDPQRKYGPDSVRQLELVLDTAGDLRAPMVAAVRLFGHHQRGQLGVRLLGIDDKLCGNNVNEQSERCHSKSASGEDNLEPEHLRLL